MTATRPFSIGTGGRQFEFTVSSDGWVRAVTRPDGSTPVIGGQFDLDHEIVVPETWTAIDEATGYNGKIAEDEAFYPGAGFDTSLVDGQVDDVLWALTPALRSSGGELLEIGCGPGFLLRALNQALPAWTVHGVDPAPESVKQARSKGMDVWDGFASDVPLDRSFDAFVIMGNFQLHTDPAETLRIMADLASPGAQLYLDLKNPRSTPRRVARWLVGKPVAGSNPRVHAFAAHAWHGMRHGIPRAAIPGLLSDNGWTVREMRTVGPRLLRFGNRHGLSRGAKGFAWRALDAADRAMGEQAWIQVAAERQR